MAIDISQVVYPHFSSIANLWPDPARLLGEEIVWQSKNDGSNAGFYLDENDNVRIRSRNRDDADPQFYALFKSCEEAEAIEMLLHDAREWGTEYVIFEIGRASCRERV